MSAPQPANKQLKNNPPQQQQQQQQQLQQQQQKSASNMPKLPLLQTVSHGANAVNDCLEHDKNWPELGDLLTRMYSSRIPQDAFYADVVKKAPRPNISGK